MADKAGRDRPASADPRRPIAPFPLAGPYTSAGAGASRADRREAAVLQLTRVCTKSRDAEAIRRLAIAPRSSPELLCNGVLRNMGAFYDALSVTEDVAV